MVFASFPRPQMKVCNAVCLGNAMHITASVCSNDNESGLQAA